MEKKYLTIPFKVTKQVNDDEYFRFEGYASTYNNVDLGDDMVTEGAFENTLKTKAPSDINLLWQHNIDMPLGVYEEIRNDKNGLFVRGKMPKEHSQVKDVMALMKCGAIKSMSIGYIPTKFDYDDRGIRLLKEIDLYEISLVTMPMNPKAVITGTKAVSAARDLPLADRDRTWESDAAMQRVRAHTGSKEEPSKTYKRAFMYYDPEKEDEFTGYKLPFADVINGKLYAVPRAIIAIAGILRGARGGVKIPEADKAKVKTLVEHYYKKMDMESPFEKDIYMHVDDEEGEYDEDEDDEGESEFDFEEDGKEDNTNEFEEYYEDWVSEYGKSKRKPIKFKRFHREDVQGIDTKRKFERCLRDSGAFSNEAAKKLASCFVSAKEAKEQRLAKQLRELTEIAKK